MVDAILRPYYHTASAGWIGQRHYHAGDVFLEVLEGSFTVDVEGKQTTIGAGEAYHEAVKAVMQARNPSPTQPTRLLLFQVGNTGERLTVITDQKQAGPLAHRRSPIAARPLLPNDLD